MKNFKSINILFCLMFCFSSHAKIVSNHKVSVFIKSFTADEVTMTHAGVTVTIPKKTIAKPASSLLKAGTHQVLEFTEEDFAYVRDLIKSKSQTN